MSRRSLPAFLAVVAVSGLAVSACGTGEQPVTASSSSPSSSSTPVPSARRPAPGPAMAVARVQLGAAALQLNQALEPLGLTQKVAVAIAPVGVVATPIVIGEVNPPQVAWSTIKVPLAIAAERKHGGPMPATVAAIAASDNSAAQALWDSLGSDEQAAAAVTRVLREGGDTRSTVPAVPTRSPYTIFGQTVWSAENAARFTAGLACLPGSERVRRLMGRVNGNQQWGAARMKAHTGVKGGWGPGTEGGYVVRQIALIGHRDGSQTAVAMVTFGNGTSMASGTAALDRVGTWLGRNAASLPRGFC